MEVQRTLEWTPFPMTVCKVESAEGLDLSAPYTFFSRTDTELSLVCPTPRAPQRTTDREDGWRMFRVASSMEFSLTGVMASLSGALARAGIPLFAVSTYDTDYIMIKAEYITRAESALLQAGWTFKNGALMNV